MRWAEIKSYIFQVTVVCHTKRNCGDKNRQKKKKKRLCSLFSERVDLKKNPELEFCKKNQLGYLCHFWYSVLLKIGVWALNRFSLRKILFCYIWKKILDQDRFLGKVWKKLIFRPETHWIAFRETVSWVCVHEKLWPDTMSYSRAWHTLRTRPLNWTTYQKGEDVVIAFFFIHDLSGKGERGKESEYFHHNSTCFPKQIRFSKNMSEILKMDI